MDFPCLQHVHIPYLSKQGEVLISGGVKCWGLNKVDAQTMQNKVKSAEENKGPFCWFVFNNVSLQHFHLESLEGIQLMVLDPSRFTALGVGRHHLARGGPVQGQVEAGWQKPPCKEVSFVPCLPL